MSLTKKEFLDKKMNSTFNNNNSNITNENTKTERNFSLTKTYSAINKNLDLKNSDNIKTLTENNFYFDKNNKIMIHYPKNFFKKEPEKQNRTKVSKAAPDWFQVVTDEKNKKIEEKIANNEETLFLLSRYNRWITVTPKSKNRRLPLEKMKIEKLDSTSRITPNWMQIRAKKDMELFDMMRSAEYNSMRHVILFFKINRKFRCYSK